MTYATAPVTDEQIAAFVAAGQRRIDEHWTEQGYTQHKTMLEADPNGIKYVRIWAVSPGQKSAWAFVERATGLIYKPASWKVPAKHARGTILEDDNGYKYVSWLGPAYMRNL